MSRNVDLTRCAECGMHVASVATFHPWVYCLLFKNGVQDPARYLRELGYTRQDPPAGVLPEGEKP